MNTYVNGVCIFLKVVFVYFSKWIYKEKEKEKLAPFFMVLYDLQPYACI